LRAGCTYLFDLKAVVGRLKVSYDRGYLVRACVQTSLYDTWWEDTVYLVRSIRNVSQIPISLSVFPLSSEKYQELKKIGVNELVIPLDACTPELFDKIKGKKNWRTLFVERHIEGIKQASGIFEKVGTHLIIGLGESDEDAVNIIYYFRENSVNAALFSYTYIQGTQLKIPDRTESETIRHYRTVQLARHLIFENIASFSDMRFREGILIDYGLSDGILLQLIQDGLAFQTSGCTGCNRPMANETFSKIYNFPRKTIDIEKESIKRDLGFINNKSPQS